MGSCVSLHSKTLEPITVKRRWWFASKTANSSSTPVLIKVHEKEDNILNHQLYSNSTPKLLSGQCHCQYYYFSRFEYGGRIDDLFFDSHACFESDCEDFFSVNGEFTPSRGSTLARQNSFADRSPDLAAHQPSPIDSQKGLAEFLHKSFSDKLPAAGVADQVPGSTPRASVSDSTKATPSQLPRSVSRCLRSLPRSLSFGEKKKRSPQTIGM